MFIFSSLWCFGQTHIAHTAYGYFYSEKQKSGRSTASSKPYRFSDSIEKKINKKTLEGNITFDVNKYILSSAQAQTIKVMQRLVDWNLTINLLSVFVPMRLWEAFCAEKKNSVTRHCRGRFVTQAEVYQHTLLLKPAFSRQHGTVQMKRTDNLDSYLQPPLLFEVTHDGCCDSLA